MGVDAQLWSTSTQQLLHNFPSRSLPELYPEWRGAVFSPDGTKLALGNDMGEVLIWDINSYELVNKLSIPLTSPLPTR
jgi:WD40 repeat protein